MLMMFRLLRVASLLSCLRILLARNVKKYLKESEALKSAMETASTFSNVEVAMNWKLKADCFFGIFSGCVYNSCHHQVSKNRTTVVRVFEKKV